MKILMFFNQKWGKLKDYFHELNYEISKEKIVIFLNKIPKKCCVPNENTAYVFAIERTIAYSYSFPKPANWIEFNYSNVNLFMLG